MTTKEVRPLTIYDAIQKSSLPPNEKIVGRMSQEISLNHSRQRHRSPYTTECNIPSRGQSRGVGPSKDGDYPSHARDLLDTVGQDPEGVAMAGKPRSYPPLGTEEGKPPHPY